jgi:hypothetical protein
MKTQTKQIIKEGLIAGLVFVTLMAGFDLANEESFQGWKYIFNIAAFGISTGFLTDYNLKKQAKNK